MSRKSVIIFAELLRVSNGGAPSMIGRTAGTVALLERSLVRPFLKYHRIIQQGSIYGKA